MKLLIRQALIIDPSSPFHSQRADISIINGSIAAIGQNLDDKDAQLIEAEGLCASPGWLDPFSHFGDPGSEFTETIDTGTAAAAAGGYTDVMLIPNTKPVMHSKSIVEYVKQRSTSYPVNIHPIAAVTINTEGKELAEMYDMQESGSVAFSDGCNSIQSSGVLLKALQYLKATDRTLIQVPDDRSVNPHGLMHEGVMSTRLGLPGKPAIAEELMIMRDIELLKYTGSRLHITGISTGRSLELIKEAKRSGLQITCSVTPYHLYFTDEDLKEYDTQLKVNPPIRGKADRDALRTGVADGSIDCIASHHFPRHTDDKIIEFEHAKNGMTTLQTAFAIVMSAMPDLSPERIVELFSSSPRSIFQIPATAFAKGQPACITLFSMRSKWTFERGQNKSRSYNTPFFDKAFHAKAVGIINKGSLFLN
jgi:dihydroorotase